MLYFFFKGISVLWKANLEQRRLIEDSVLKEAVSADKLRIFASGSQTMQRALHPHVAGITHNISIELLVRTDGSLARQGDIAQEVERWRRDIQKANVKLAIRSYSFEPVMVRGIIVDDRIAFTGWYYREAGSTHGQSDPVFRVTDESYVSAICTLFDRMFAAGTPL